MAKSRVKKRPDGRYAMQIYLGTVDGKRKYKTVYGGTPKEVQKKADEVRILKAGGSNPSGCVLCFGVEHGVRGILVLRRTGTLDNFREWLSDNLRYILLGLAILLALVLLFFGVKALTGGFF